MVSAQEATLSGTVSDSTGGALPGVTVRAVHEASGNSFEAVTDERGDYRLPVRIGAYRLTAELAGFAPVTRTVTLLVGQQAVVNLQMDVSGVQESVTVTGEAPLLDVTQSSLGGNIDSRQMQELPVQGRAWVDLVMLAPGSRVNSVTGGAPSDAGASTGRTGGDFELNVDGQQVTTLVAAVQSAAKGQPHFSRDVIAEFEFVSSQFDATQGRSTGMQVNVVTKSGSNTPSGSFSGYFRHDRFNAADHVAKRVLPYQDQQFVGTFGGPIRRDKLHVFGNYEYEREPQTKVYTTPYPYFNRDFSVTHTEKKAGVRLDAQFSPQTRLMIRGSGSRSSLPGGGGGASTPSSMGTSYHRANQLMTSLTQVLSNRVVNELKVGYNGVSWYSQLLLKNPGARFDGLNGPRIFLQGFGAGGAQSYPDRQGQDVYSVRDDFTYSFTKGGRHTVKLGAEYLHQRVHALSCTRCDGELDATGGPIPANLESLFPDLFDASTWNLAPLSPISRSWSQLFGSVALVIPRYTTGVWVQDDWTVSARLTLNLGLRYDLELNAFANDVQMLPFLTGDQPNDTNNLGPRLGFSFSVTDRTVMRGGYGLYFGTVANNHFAKAYSQTITLPTLYDGRPDFAANPFNGPAPTYESILARICTPALVPGCLRREAPTGGEVFAPNMTIPYSHQVSIGLQRQLGTTMAFEADYAYGGRRGTRGDLPANITYNPDTGVNYPFSDISRRAFPEWGFVSLTVPGGRINSHALQTAVTKRFSAGWQASGTYTLAGLWDAGPRPIQWNGSQFETVPFPTAPDLGGEYSLGVGDQRHRAVVNGIWQLPYRLQLSGLYFFGSGERHTTRYGTDLRQIGATRPGEYRLRPDGTIVPRNSFVGKPIHRVDLRVQRRFPLGGRAGIDGMLEIFNAFNHANYGSYTGLVGVGFAGGGEVLRNYKQPAQSTNVAFAPRTLQLGFRFAF
jgi:hypothetical protein